MIERLTDPSPQGEDSLSTVRPESFEDFTGQSRILSNLRVYVQAARERKEPLDHVLLMGPPGLGKTTLAQIVAKEMGAPLKSTSAPALEKSGDVASLLSGLQAGDVLFIDEIHRLRPVLEEILYGAMEDFKIDIQLGQGMTAQSVKIEIAPFTLIGATTKPGSLTAPLLSRFGIVGQFEFYRPEELIRICERNAAFFRLRLEADAVREISGRSRGTPRILNRLLRRIRDFAQVSRKDVVDLALADWALEQMHIDKRGLDPLDRRLLTSLLETFGGGPVGLENLAVSIGEDPGTLEDLVEPYLIQIGLIKRTSRGRIATRAAWTAIGKETAPTTLFDLEG